jgi:DNA helicase-2/ATP-dependent DNA helicase PcrA
VIDAWVPEPPADAVNPTAAKVAEASWPYDPLGERRPALTEAAALVVSLAPTQQDPSAVPTIVDSAEAEEAARWRYEAEILLAEREQLARRATAVDIALPEHLTVSQLVTLRRDPQALARSLRRPMPTRPDPYSRRGTAFHRWLEQRFGADRLFDLDELPGAADEDAAPDDALAELQRQFLASEWAQRTPIEVEVPFATEIGGVVVRGRMDAVFGDPDGRYDVVDWKTGRRPVGAEATAAAVQLAAYRLAWSDLAGVPVRRVQAAFHYVQEGVTVRPADLLDAGGLTALVTSVPPSE